MHVAIDLGEKYTHMACWENDREMDSAIINVRIPGVAEFAPHPRPYSWHPQNVRDYLLHLQREYLLPSRKIVESAALAVPEILSLHGHRRLLGVVEEILGLEEARIIPRPLALTAGYNHHHHDRHPLRGDILLIQGQEEYLDLSLLSSSETAGITLERQLGRDLALACQELTALGCRDQTGGRLDYVLAAGDLTSRPEWEDFFAALPGEIQVISEPDLNLLAVAGLYTTLADKSIASSNRLSFIYPYEFYLETSESTHRQPRLQRIPFDTANLELAWDGIYRLTSLDDQNLDILQPESARMKFNIYELPAGQLPSQEIPLTPAQLVLAIDSPRDDLPHQLVVILDMAAASLHLDLDLQGTTSTSIGPEVLRHRLAANQARLLQLLKSRDQNDNLVPAGEEHRHSYRPDSSDLAQQVQSTLLHVYALTRLWREN